MVVYVHRNIIGKQLNSWNKRWKSRFFFFFSDDCLYVETEFADIRNKIIISHNRDDRSFFDMYLMAHAKNMILANSTFSCWAAYLNRTAKIIITPDRWVNTDFSKLEALPNEWIKIRV